MTTIIERFAIDRIVKERIDIEETLNLNKILIERIFFDIIEERKIQLEKFKEQIHIDNIWNLILVEEIGEISKAILDDAFKENSGNLEEEIIQVMAVCLAWLESINRNKTAKKYL